VTRSHKFNDKDHAGLADGTALPQEHLPRYFAKSGHVDADPKKFKKNGAGKANWYVLSLVRLRPLRYHPAHPFFFLFPAPSFLFLILRGYSFLLGLHM
jgi:hypothetical protein